MRNRWIATVAGSAVACGAAVLGLHAAANAEPGTPREAVQQYYDAIADRDGESAWDLLCRTQQQQLGPERRFIAAFTSPDYFVGGSPGPAGEAVPFEPFPVQAWRVDSHLVIREGDDLRLCGDPQHLYEDRAGMPSPIGGTW